MDAPDRETEVLRAQVAALYASSWISTLADALLAWALCAVFYWQTRNSMVLLWAALHLLQLLRYPLLHAYHRDPQAAQRSAFWARRQCRELLIYSSVWGLAPWLFLPTDNLPLTVLLMLLMLGLSSGGVPAVAPRWPSVLCFVVPMVLGLITALAWQGDAVHLFLAACTTIYLGATLYFARQQHRLLTDALHMKFEKHALVEQLAQQMATVRHLSQEKTRFFAAASHDLRQPLHAITLFGAVLKQQLAGRPEYTHAARLMDSVRALGVSLDTMLDASRLDSGVIVPDVQAVALNTVFQQVNQLFSALAEQKGLQLRLRASPYWVQTDRHLLQRMLANLVENAIKYTARGGVLVVARAYGQQIRIDVCDTGIGISQEQLGQVFDEYYQANNPGRDRTLGLGIGLAIVSRLSGLLGHALEVQSRPGRGSRFRIVLPAVRPDQPLADPLHGQGATKLQRASPVPDGLPQRVLLLDDEEDIGHAVTALLGSHGVALTAVRDEASADQALIQASRGLPFEAFIFDYRLSSGVDGLDVALRLRQRFDPQLPLLLVTGETTSTSLQAARDLGIAVLQKPSTAESLLGALRKLRRMH